MYSILEYYGLHTINNNNNNNYFLCFQFLITLIKKCLNIPQIYSQISPYF